MESASLLWRMIDISTDTKFQNTELKALKLLEESIINVSSKFKRFSGWDSYYILT